mmetsp:Transcript_94580/g.264831  ORF Transcript_94580/g.264831 Transcript_94580/m.264831 type:complete len:213 (-) Transcript_94580:167-805(-)
MASFRSGSASSMTPPTARPPMTKPAGPVFSSLYFSRMSWPSFVGSYSTCFLIASLCLAFSASAKFTLDNSSPVSTRFPSLSRSLWSLNVRIVDSGRSFRSCLTFIFGTSAAGAAAFLLPDEDAEDAAAVLAAFMLPSLFLVLFTQSAAPPAPSSRARMSPRPSPVTSSLCASLAFFDAPSFFLPSSDFPGAGACTGALEVPSLDFVSSVLSF